LADQRRAVDSAGHSRGSTRGRANPAGARSTKPPNARPAASDSQRVSGTAQGRKSVRRRSDSTAARLSNPSAGRSSGLAPQGSALSTPKHPPKARGGTPLIDVDYASVEELEVLPHVGPALAARIVTNRQAGGRFGSLDSLVARVKGIGPVTATVLRPLVTFGGR
jgi:competence protein ComEA